MVVMHGNYWKKAFLTLSSAILLMEKVSGMELLKRVRSTDNTLPFIIITGAGTIETAVEATQLGAFHYVTKTV